MKSWVKFYCFLAALVICAGCKGGNKATPGTVGTTRPAGSAPATPGPNEVDPVRGHLLHAQGKLPTIKVWVGAEELVPEIAIQPVEIITGMMYRTNMPENTAMIFV